MKVLRPNLMAVVLLLLLLDLPAALSASQLVFPQLVQGPGASASLVLVNSGATENSGQVEFLDPTGQPLELHDRTGEIIVSQKLVLEPGEQYTRFTDEIFQNPGPSQRVLHNAD